MPPRLAAAASLVGRRPAAWMRYASCVGRATRQHDPWSPPPTAFFPPREAVEICDQCPVKVACLAQAFEIHDDYTVRGGLTWRQRNALKRPHLRQTCPSCGAFTEADTIRANVQICIACGVSWLVSREVVIEVVLEVVEAAEAEMVTA